MCGAHGGEVRDGIDTGTPSCRQTDRLEISPLCAFNQLSPLLRAVNVRELARIADRVSLCHHQPGPRPFEQDGHVQPLPRVHLTCAGLVAAQVAGDDLDTADHLGSLRKGNGVAGTIVAGWSSPPSTKLPAVAPNVDPPLAHSTSRFLTTHRQRDADLRTITQRVKFEAEGVTRLS